MKSLLARAVIGSVLFAPLAFSAQAADLYKLDPYHTSVTWHANHMGFSTPSGKFTQVDGGVLIDEAKPENGKLEVSIATKSILTGIEKFDAHLKGPDFFNVEKHPYANFTSTRVELTGKDTAKVYGNLTLLGIAKPIFLDVKLNKIGENPMNKKKTAGFSATTTIKRSEFGMNYGVPAVADDVQVAIEAEAVR